MAVLTQEGLIFFLNRSDKARAIPFQKWVAGDVLPQIINTGTYSTRPTALESADPCELERTADFLARKAKLLREIQDMEQRFQRGELLTGARKQIEPVRAVNVHATAPLSRKEILDSPRWSPEVQAALDSSLMEQIEGKDEVVAIDIVKAVFRPQRWNRAAQMIIASWLKRHGFRRENVMKDGKRRWVYQRIKSDLTFGF